MSIKAPSESDLVRQVLAWLHLHRVCCWRANTFAHHP
jgi:hypothetical protein